MRLVANGSDINKKQNKSTQNMCPNCWNQHPAFSSLTTNLHTPLPEALCRKLPATRLPVRTDEFFEPVGMWDADCLLGPPQRNLGLKSRRNGRMDHSQVPRLPRTTSSAFKSFGPRFVDFDPKDLLSVRLNYKL